MPSLLVLTGTVAIITWLTQLFYSAFLSPLSAIPNAHLLAPFTKLWILWLRYTEREHRMRYDLHKKLGPVIRLGPSELSINCIDNGVATIYHFDKSPWYQNFDFYGELFSFKMTSGAMHAKHKRMVIPVYSKSSIECSEVLSRILDEVLVKRFKRKAEIWSRDGKAVDMQPETQALSNDITSCYLFGLNAGSNFVEDANARDHFLKSFVQSLDGTFWFYFPVVRKCASCLGIKLVPDTVRESQLEIENFCSNMCNMARSVIEKGKNDNTEASLEEWPTVYATLRENLGKNITDPRRLDRMVAAEMLDHLVAGNEGAGNVMTWVTLELSRHPDAQRRLREEFSTLYSIQDRANALDTLPFLDAVVQETIRLHPPGLGPHLRVVPSEGVQLGRYPNIPGGTTVSATAWSLHRNEDIYPAPEVWLPERWLDKGNKVRLRKWFFGFGAGNRQCFGNHLANRVIKEYILATWSRFETRIVECELTQTDDHKGRPEGNLSVTFHVF